MNYFSFFFYRKMSSFSLCIWKLFLRCVVFHIDSFFLCYFSNVILLVSGLHCLRSPLSTLSVFAPLIMLLFSLAAFIPFSSGKLIMMRLGLISCFLLLGYCWPCWIYRFIILINFKKYFVIISLNIFFFHPLFSSGSLLAQIFLVFVGRRFFFVSF